MLDKVFVILVMYVLVMTIIYTIFHTVPPGHCGIITSSLLKGNNCSNPYQVKIVEQNEMYFLFPTFIYRDIYYKPNRDDHIAIVVVQTGDSSGTGTGTGTVTVELSVTHHVDTPIAACKLIEEYGNGSKYEKVYLNDNVPFIVSRYTVTKTPAELFRQTVEFAEFVKFELQKIQYEKKSGITIDHIVISSIKLSDSVEKARSATAEMLSQIAILEATQERDMKNAETMQKVQQYEQEFKERQRLHEAEMARKNAEAKVKTDMILAEAAAKAEVIAAEAAAKVKDIETKAKENAGFSEARVNEQLYAGGDNNNFVKVQSGMALAKHTQDIGDKILSIFQGNSFKKKFETLISDPNIEKLVKNSDFIQRLAML